MRVDPERSSLRWPSMVDTLLSDISSMMNVRWFGVTWTTSHRSRMMVVILPLWSASPRRMSKFAFAIVSIVLLRKVVPGGRSCCDRR